MSHFILCCPLFVMASIIFWMFPANAPAAKRTHEKTHSEDISIKKAVKLLKCDLPAIKKRCYIRVLISCSKTKFLIEKGTMYGFEYGLLKQYEKFLNKGIKKEQKNAYYLHPIQQAYI